MVAVSDFPLTSRRMIIETGNQTLPIVIINFQNKTLRATFMLPFFIFTNYTEHPQPYRISSSKCRISDKRGTIS